MSAELPLNALPAFIPKSEDPDFRYVELAEPWLSDVGDGQLAISLEGDEDTIAFSEGLFNRNGTLQDNLQAIYVKGQHPDQVMRIERDGSWINAMAPNPFLSSGQSVLERGRLDEYDVAFSLVNSTAPEDTNVVLFSAGIGTLRYIESITLIPSEPQEMPKRPMLPVFQNDVVKRFDAYLSQSILNAEE